MEHQDPCVPNPDITLVYRGVNMSADAGDPPERDGGIQIYHESTWTVVNNDDNGPLEISKPEDPIGQVTSETCSFWKGIKGFTPKPAASFLKEFERLAMLKKWSKKERRVQLVKALDSEIDFHGDKSVGLVRWQRLCQEVGIGSEPQSVRGCKKVVKSRFVNLYSFLDYYRNPSIPLVCFDSRKELVRDIGTTGAFPRQCAKRDIGMRGLLKKI